MQCFPCSNGLRTFKAVCVPRIRLRRSQYARCYAVASRTYDDAIELLNTLQTPYNQLAIRRNLGMQLDGANVKFMQRCLDRIGYTQSDLTKLNIIHVAGTKGKGTTCAYVDSILRQYGKSHDVPRNIGLYTSPHLIAVRERIRINGIPITRELFAKYCFELWDMLEAAEIARPDTHFEKPRYFRYLTLMSYHVFLSEGIDVAIYETGVGGEYDATNLVQHPIVTGISTIGYDHLYSLGESLPQIAWHKAGIQKKDVPSFALLGKFNVEEVLYARSKEKHVKKFTILKAKNPRLEGVKLTPNEKFQELNATLAIALAETALKKMDPKYEKSRNGLQKAFVDGLEQMVWRGRCETKVDGNITWFLDGAHTVESIDIAARWFRKETMKRKNLERDVAPWLADKFALSGSELSRSAVRCLIFNQQGERNALELVEKLYNVIVEHDKFKFDHVVFCTTAPKPNTTSKDSVNHTLDHQAIENLTLQEAFAWKWRAFDPSASTTIKVVPYVEDALEYVRNLDIELAKKEKKVHALITGSVHLVGRALGVLENVDAL